MQNKYEICCITKLFGKYREGVIFNVLKVECCSKGFFLCLKQSMYSEIN